MDIYFLIGLILIEFTKNLLAELKFLIFNFTKFEFRNFCQVYAEF